MIQVNRPGNPFHGLWALTNRDLKKWYKEPFQLFMTILQPILWMGLFGKAMNIGAIFSSNPNIPPQLAELLMTNTFGTSDYFSYMAVGMISFVSLFTTMFSGMSIVWDRRFGVLDKILSTPVARSVIVFSKLLAATVRSLVQAGIVLVIAVVLGLKVGPSFAPLNLVGVFAITFLVCIGLSSIFLMIGIRSTRWETQMAVMNLLNLPLMFSSNSLFPISTMPDWLQTIARLNPLTYASDGIRQLLVYQMNASQLLVDFTYLGVFAVVFATIGIVLSWKFLSK
jgi:ABC-2 type transport system permease protein